MPRPSKRPEAVAHPAHPRLSAARRAERFCVRAGLAIILLAVALLSYLHLVGIPGWARDRWIRAQESKHTYLSVGHMSFNLFEGLVAHDFAYYETERRVLPVLEADKVDLRLHALEWLRGRSGWSGMAVERGTIRFAPGGGLVQADPGQILTLNDLDGSLSWTDQGFEIESLRGTSLGIRFHGSGRVDLSPSTNRVGRGYITDADAGLFASSRGPDWLPPLVAQLNQIEFNHPPDLEVDFTILPRDLAHSTIAFSGFGMETRVRGVDFDQWRVSGTLDQGTVTLTQVMARHAEKTLAAAGTYRLASREIAGHLSCDLPPAHWLSLMPIAWRDRLEAHGFIFSGPAICAVAFGPVRPGAIWRDIRGTVDAEKAEVHGLWFERFRCDFASTPERLQLTNVDMALGANGEHGTARGDFDWRFSDGGYAGVFQSSLDFAGLAPILPDRQLALARSVILDGPPLSAAIRFQGRKGEGGGFHAEGAVAGTNLFYRGAHINRGQTRLTISNRVVRLDDLYVERDEGRVDGSIHLDFENRFIGLALAGVVDAKAVGRVSGPVVERILRNFEFDGPINGSADGVVYFGNRPQTHLRVLAEGDGIALRAYRSDHLRAEILWTNNVIDVRSFDADIYGGTVTGSFATILQEIGLPPQYRLSAQAREVSFEEVVRTMAHREGEPYRGRISGALDLGGVLAGGHGAEAVGHGRIRIADGRIMRIPLFGGLSRGLSQIYPGLGFASQTDFSAPFEVRNLNVYSKDVELEGGVFSLHGVGGYGLVQRTLNFTVEFKLLREGNFGNVVRLVTLPLTKLLEFDLEGTLDAPRWRPKNLPKELFSAFE